MGTVGAADSAVKLLQQAASALQALLSPYAQGSRLLKLDFLDAIKGEDEVAALAALGAPALVVERFVGSEAINAPFEFAIDALSPSAFLDLGRFLGRSVQLSVATVDGSPRSWNGLIAAMQLLDSDGGLARYRLVLRPFTEYLALRHDARIFQAQTTQQIVSDVLSAHERAAFRFDVGSPGRQRPLCTQYDESDWAFVSRLLAEEGWNYHFEHSEQDHSLVIFDADASLALPAGAQPLVRFHRSDATESTDTITALSEVNRVQPNAVTLAGWDAQNLLAAAGDSSALNGFANVPTLEWFSGNRSASLGRFDAQSAAQAALQQSIAFEAASRSIQGAGTVRHLAPGTQIAVTAYNESRSVVVSAPLLLHIRSVGHAAANNLGAGIAAARALVDDHASELECGTYRNTFSAIPAGVAIAPVYVPKPSAPGMQTALVVGLPNAALTSHRDHAVRVQFHFQRGETPNPGGLRSVSSHPANAPGNGHPTLAHGDERTGTWVRIAEAQAGPDWGTVFVPRIGSEVLIDFLDGDLDNPVIVGSLYNSEDAPPFSAGIDSAANHPGVLSGWHQPTVEGGGYNQWLLDDATGQLRTRLQTAQASSSLSLGYLIEQRASAAGGSQRGRYRGEGVELSSQAWGVVRATQGLLLSSSAVGSNLGASSDSATGIALSAAGVAAQLKGAAALADALAQAASQQGATAANTAKAFNTLAQQLEAPEKAAQQGRPERPSPQAIEAASHFEKPFLIAESPESLALSTPASSVSMAGQHIHQLSQGDAQFTALATYSQVSGQGASFYTHAGGANLIAASGPLSLQAHGDALSVLADQSVTITSSSEGILIQAKEKIVLAAGQSAITLEDGKITIACPGTFTVKGAQQGHPGGKSVKASLKGLPSGSAKASKGEKLVEEKASHWIALQYLDPATGKGMAGVEYEIRFASGKVLKGKLDAAGLALHENVDNKPVKEIVYKPRDPEKEPAHVPLSKLLG